MKILSVDVGTSSIKFCLSSVRKKEFHVHRLLQIPIPDSEKPLDQQMEHVASLIVNAIRDHQLGGDRLVIGIPSSMCSFRFISVPFTKQKKIEQVLPFEVEDIVPFSSEELIIDYQVVTQNKGSSELFLAMIPQVNYGNYMANFIEQRLEADVVMPDSVAYSVFCEKFIPQDVKTTVLIDIGHHHSSMTFVREGRMEYVRPIPFGYMAFSENVRATTQYSQAEIDALVHGYEEFTPQQREQYQEIIDQAMTQLVVEVNQTIIAYRAKTKRDIGEILVSGGFGRFGYIVPTLEAELGLAVSPIAKISGVIRTQEPLDLFTYATAIGYGARYATPKPQHYVNFRRKETKTQKILDEIKTYLEASGTRQAIRAIFILILVLIPYLFAKSLIVNMHHEKSRKDIDRLMQKVVEGNASKAQRERFLDDPDELLNFLKKSLDTESLKVSVFEKKRHSPLTLMHKLMKQKPDHLQIDVPQFEFTQDRLIMVFQVVSGEVGPYLTRIKSLPLFQQVDITEMSPGRYEVSASLKGLNGGSHE